jgi:uncharacterized membrane protein
LTRVVHRNIATLLEFRRKTDREQSFAEHLTQVVVRFLGSFWSVMVHAAGIGFWLVVNTGHVPGVQPFDRPPFVTLAVIASLESIFLTTFVLLSHNQIARMERSHSDLDLQINLLAEHEITRLLHITEAIAVRLEVAIPPRLDELKRDVEPERVLAEIARAEKQRP